MAPGLSQRPPAFFLFQPMRLIAGKYYLIAILYPPVLWILTSTCALVLLCIAIGSWVPIRIHGYLITILPWLVATFKKVSCEIRIPNFLLSTK